MNPDKMKGVVYDLDGTIISTAKIHDSAWVYAGKKFNIKVTKKMLIFQRGMTNIDGAKNILKEKFDSIGKDFIKAKQQYVFDNIYKARLNDGFLDAFGKLDSLGIKVWICTSSPQDYVKKVFSEIKEIGILKNNVVNASDYSNGKPNAEPLLVTFKKMNLNNKECVYVGDALNDYFTAMNAKCRFVHFCAKNDECMNFKDKSVISISNHLRILEIINH